MKNTLFLLFCVLFCATTLASQSQKDSKPNIKVVAEEGNPNFIHCCLENVNALANAKVTWTAKGNDVHQGTTAVFYFERKGTYKVKVLVKTSSKTYSVDTKVKIADDSQYFKRGEKLVWSDEFSGNVVDTLKWAYNLGTGRWGGNELQEYTSSVENAFIRDGNLVINTIRRGEGTKVGDYTSARLVTRGHCEINRGRVEVRAKMPGVKGTQPAIWLYGRNAAPNYSEIDIMEYVAYDRHRVYGTVHTSATLAKPKEEPCKNEGYIQMDDIENTFHVYGMNLSESQVDIYVDDPLSPYLTFTPVEKENPRFWPFQSTMYIILNNAVGRPWAARHGIDFNAFPCEMEIDYVRVFQ